MHSFSAYIGFRVCIKGVVYRLWDSTKVSNTLTYRVLDKDTSLYESLYLNIDHETSSDIQSGMLYWPVVREAALTRDKLRKREIPICSRCYFCGQEAETIIHLFLHCRVTSQLWHLSINLRSIWWTMPQRTSELLSCWNEGENCSATNKDG